MLDPSIDPQFLCETARYRELSKLEHYLGGTQYEHCPGLKEWHDDTAPLRERKPCIVYPLPRAAVQQAVRFALGEGKFPRISVEPTEAADELAPQLAITVDQSESVDRGVHDLIAQSLLASAFRTALTRGLSARTAVLALSVKDGRFRFEHPKAKDCLPVFRDNDPCGDVIGLTWAYQYEAIVADERGAPKEKRRFFRRDYTDSTIVEYEPADVRIGERIDWKVSEVVEHDLGECPILWIPNLTESGGTGIDGISIYDGLLNQFDALNRALSQRHHGLEILGVPQPYETGVVDGDGPGMAGRTATPVAKDPRAPSAGFSSLESRRAASQAARKAGAQHLWSYKGENVELGLLETTGKAFEVASAHVNDIRSRLLEAMNVILLDPTTVAGNGDMSAKALALMYAPMLALVDELREWWWEHGIKRAIEMMLRIVSRLGTGGLLVRGAGDLESLLKRRTVPLDDGTSVWVAPRLSAMWGAYFAPSAEETKLEIEAASKAKKEKLVSAKTATQFVASHFGIDDAQKELDEIDSESDQAEPPPATPETGKPNDNLSSDELDDNGPGDEPEPKRDE